MAWTPARPRRRSMQRNLAALSITIALAACAGPSGSPAPASSPAGGSAGSPSGLVGSWTTTVTKADLAAAGIADPNAQDENSGRFNWLFGADGTWTQVQESIDGSPINNPVFRGTYTVDGSTLVVTTTFPPEYADAGLHFTWRIDGAGLHVDVLDPPDSLMPVVVETHPWSRAG
jgi:hypothetical protein